jgi:hypothetical protein
LNFNRKRHEAGIVDVESKQNTMKENLNKIQQQLQQAKLKMAMK